MSKQNATTIVGSITRTSTGHSDAAQRHYDAAAKQAESVKSGTVSGKTPSS